MYVSAVQDVMQINILSFNLSELCVELRPRPSSNLSSNELEPLKLSVSWSHDNRFTLQVTCQIQVQDTTDISMKASVSQSLCLSAGERGDRWSGGGLYVRETLRDERRPAGGVAELHGSG